MISRVGIKWNGSGKMVYVLACVLWFAVVIFAIVLTCLEVKRTVTSIEEATSGGRPPLTLPTDTHPALLAMIGGGELSLVHAFAATVQRLTTRGVFALNRESQSIGYASLDVKEVPDELDSIDAAAVQLVQALSRAEVRDRGSYSHFARIYYREFYQGLLLFNECVQRAYDASPYLLKNTVRFRYAWVWLLCLWLPASIAFAIFFGFVPCLVVFLGTLLCAIICASVGAKLTHVGDLNAAGVSLRKQVEEEKDWLVLFAAGKTGGDLDMAELVQVSVHAVACDRTAEFGAGACRSRNGTALRMVPGLQLVIPQDSLRGMSAIAAYVSSVMHGWTIAEGYAENEDGTKVLAEGAATAAKEYAKYQVVKTVMRDM